ncbi:uncharacterized protein LOC129036202 [Pongo pygmaeus]|uniref:uncharacterized protein LOC129036202 n=1 Tax=Pongo pygmaeus TaxID=9600 RepID=UPI0023E09AEC|nr:uncharacterized protein LOC129036202 [Pongo pygmaeus]
MSAASTPAFGKPQRKRTCQAANQPPAPVKGWNPAAQFGCSCPKPDRLKTSSQMVNRVERNELESYTESTRDTAPGPGRARGGRRFPTAGGGTPKRRGTQVSTPPTRPPGVGALRPCPTSPAQAAAWPGDPAPGQGFPPTPARKARAPTRPGAARPPGTASNKSPARSPCSSPSFSILP